jgi:hypothetical protein
MKIIPFIVMAEERKNERKKERKKDKRKEKESKKNFSKESLQNAVNIMEYHCNFLQQQKLSVQQHYYQSLTAKSKYRL